jgi:hypothetical protein
MRDASPAGHQSTPPRWEELEICFETFAPEELALLLVIRLGTHIVAWPVEFCRRRDGRASS